MTEATKDKVGGLADALPTDALKDAGQRLLGLLVQRAAQAATERVGGLTDRLNDVTQNGGQGLTAALRGGERDDEHEDDDEHDDSGDGSRSGIAGVADKIKGLFGIGKRAGGGKKLKVTNIVEHLDIGLPLRTTYNLWSQYEDFPKFMKKLENVDRLADEKTSWKAQIFLSHRTWEATTIEQVADSHIVWRSKGAKGHVDGGVTFTELGPNLTRVLLVLEYWPQGLFEKTGNIWRAQGRRARLEFKHFRRHAMTAVILHPEDIEGWRGEIRDAEVVKTHEEALEEEQAALEEEQGPEEQGPEEDPAAAEAEEPEAAEDEPYEEGAYAEDEEEPAEDAEDEYADDYEDEDEEAGDVESEDVEEPTDGRPGGGRRAEPVGARSRRGR